MLQDGNRIGTYVAALPYPTPINVSIRPVGVEASKNTKQAVAIPIVPRAGDCAEGLAAPRAQVGCTCCVS